MNGGSGCSASGIKLEVFGRFCRRSTSRRAVGGFCQMQTFAAGELNDRLWSKVVLAFLD